MPQKEKKSNKKKKLHNYAKYSGIAGKMLVTIALGVFGGVYADKALNLEFPIFTIVLSLVAVVLAIYITIKDFI